MQYSDVASNLLIAFVVTRLVIRMLKHPSKKDLDSLLKPQLKQAAQRLNIGPGEQTKKVELKLLVLDYFIEEDLISDDKLISSVNSKD